MKRIVVATLLTITLAACTTTSENPGHATQNTQDNQTSTQPTQIYETPSTKFMERLAAHKGKSYEGEITAGGRQGDGFTGERLVMHVDKVEENRICVPFHVGENRSRVWILTLENDRILLKHDHRHEDGTPDEVTMYGGLTTNQGTENIQVFPADQQTRELIDYAAQNVWSMTIDDSTFTYNLQRIGTDRHFSVRFDLTRPVQTPPSAWGWEK